MLRHVRLTTLVALCVVIPAIAAAAAPFAYISNSGSATVSVVDLAAPNGVSTIPLPGSVLPWGIALNRAGTRLYVTNMGNGSVFVVDTTATPPVLTATVLWPSPAAVVPKQPVAVAVNPAGTRVYVSFFHRELSTFGGAVSMIDAATNSILATVAVGILNEGIAVHPDGTRVYLASSNGVMVLDADTLAPLSTIAVGTRPFGLAFNDSGSKLFVTNNGGNSVSRVDTATGTVDGEVFVGAFPIGIALNPDGTRAYVANNASGSISVIDAATMTLAAPDVALGGAPYGVDVAGDGRIVVANSAAGSSNIWIIDPATFAVSSKTVGASPVAFGRFIHRPSIVETMLRLSVSPESAIYGSAGPLTFTATLLRKDNGAPVSGGSVAFQVDGAAAGTAVTNSAGSATLAYNPSALGVGAHLVRAAFSESAINGVTHTASEASAAFTVAYQFEWRSSGGAATAGSAIPVRWSLTDANGNAIVDAQFEISSAACPAGALRASTGRVKANYAGNSELRYDSSNNQYVFNWKTDKAWAGTCRQFIVDARDGVLHSLTFQFR